MAPVAADLIKPTDLLPEYAAKLAEEWPEPALPPNWQEFTSWGALEDIMRIPPDHRTLFEQQRHHYQQLTAEALTAAAGGKSAAPATATAPAQMSSNSTASKPNGNLDRSSSGRSRQYTPSGPPVCRRCGGEGHTSSSCSTSYCSRCKRYGHEEGQCTRACSRCGHLHPPYADGSKYRCVHLQCRECNLFGHKIAQCPMRQCSCCSHYGHIARDCPACPDCWTYHQQGSCPGYCKHCDALGHWTSDCTKRPARQGGQGQALKDDSNGSQTSQDSHHKRSARSAPAGNSSSNSGQQQGSWRSSSVQLLPVASPEQDASRREELMDTLLTQLQEYAMSLLADEQKLSVLARLAPEALQAVLQQKNPQQQLDAIYACWKSSEHGRNRQQQEKQPQEKRRDSSCDGGSGSFSVPPNQLPDHIVAQMEASLPPGLLPDDWASYSSWGKVDDLLRPFKGKVHRSTTFTEIRRRFREAKHAACAAAAAELVPDLSQHPQQQQYRKWRDVQSAISWVGHGGEVADLFKQFRLAQQFASDGSVVTQLAQHNVADGMVPPYPPGVAAPAFPAPAAQPVPTLNSIRPATLPEQYAQQLQAEFEDVLPSDWREFSSWRSLEAKVQLVNGQLAFLTLLDICWLLCAHCRVPLQPVPVPGV
eukprot:gene10915-11070_t